MPESQLLPILLGLATAVCWGAGDFCGGLASKTNSLFSVVIGSQLVGMLGLLVIALVTREAMPAPIHLLWSVAGGISSAVGLSALYRALAGGKMSLAAPVAAVVTAAVPVVASLFIAGLPERIQVIGFGLAVAGIWLVASGESTAPIRLHDLRLPIIAGVGFGMLLVSINQASQEGIFFPLVVVRLTCLLTMVIAATRQQPQRPIQVVQWPIIALAGILDTGANVLFGLAGQSGRLDIVAVLASLYPVSTVVLAGLILKERISRQQGIGILVVLIAIVLITV